MYQWSAAMNGATIQRAQGVCPAGWHIPSDCEVMYLEHGQGMSITEQQVVSGTTRANTSDNQGTPAFKLRAAGGTFSNASGFSILLSGRRVNTFNNRNSHGYIWTSTSTGIGLASLRVFQSNQRGVGRTNTPTNGAYSVRCLKD